MANPISQYFDDQNRLSREDGPAQVWDDGCEEWYLHGDLHHVGGPSRIDGRGESWHTFGKLHRIDGPAHIINDFGEFWYNKGQRHRTDGPASFLYSVPSRPFDYYEWWVDDVRYADIHHWLDILDVTIEEKVLLKMKWG